jgi:hypothetical protein
MSKYTCGQPGCFIISDHTHIDSNIQILQSKLHRAQCEVNELQNTLKLERELKERYQCALREIVPYGDLTMHASKDFIWKSLKAAQRLAREALR